MPNADRPRGFKPHEEVLRLSSYTAGGIIYPGDAVKMNASGKIVVAAAGDALRGVAANYASADGAAVSVWDDPDQKFQVQASTSVAAADVGLNYDILATAGNATYKQSRQEMDSTVSVTSGITGSAQLRLVGIAPEVNNAPGADVDCIVLINEHELRQATGV